MSLTRPLAPVNRSTVRLVAPQPELTGSQPAAERGPSTVLRAALTHGPLGRSALARLTGLSPAAVSRHTAALIDLGLIAEAPRAAGRPAAPRAGRPEVPIDIDTGHHVVFGLHIAYEHLTFALLDLRGGVLAAERVPHGGTPAAVVERARSGGHAFLARHAAGRSVLGLGAVTGGWVDAEQGVVVENAALGWANMPLRAELASAFRLPVYLDGHARALARAELLFGASRDRADLVQLFVGNVVDCAIAIDGKVLHGTRFGAGGVAHLPLGDPDLTCSCGRRGCLQPAVAEREMAARAHAAGVVAEPAADALRSAAARGERAALALYAERLRVLARAVALLVDLLNPARIALAEFAMINLPRLRGELHAEVARLSHLCPRPETVVVPNTFGNDVLAAAAGAVVLDVVHHHPLELRVAARSSALLSAR